MTNPFKNKKKESLIIRVLVMINYLVIVPLLISYLAAFISPNKSWIIAVFGLFLPLFALINVGFVVTWTLFWKKYFFISLISLLLGIPFISNIIQTNSHSDEQSIKNAIKVLSFNTQNFDLYNYNKDWSINYTKRNEIFNFLSKDTSDIACFQEFVYIKEHFPTWDTMPNFMKAKNTHVEFLRSNKNNYFGIATFSSYPIIYKGLIPFKSTSSNACIFTDLVVNDDTLRVYNLHFESVRLDQSQYDLSKNTAKNSKNTTENALKGKAIKLLKSLRKAYKIRSKQVEIVTNHIDNCPYPVLLCGDFNDPPGSYAYHNISKTLIDAFANSGRGLGNTYIGKFPFNLLRIDYIFHSPSLQSYNFETVPVELSDHHPITCYIEVSGDE